MDYKFRNNILKYTENVMYESLWPFMKSVIFTPLAAASGLLMYITLAGGIVWIGSFGALTALLGYKAAKNIYKTVKGVKEGIADTKTEIRDEHIYQEEQKENAARKRAEERRKQRRQEQKREESSKKQSESGKYQEQEKEKQKQKEQEKETAQQKKSEYGKDVEEKYYNSVKSMTPYQILGVSTDASIADIKKAYRKMMSKIHPDINKDDVAASKLAAEVNKAYEFLKKRHKNSNGTTEEPSF